VEQRWEESDDICKNSHSCLVIIYNLFYWEVDMKIAISSSGTSLDSNVDPRFGRCQYYIIYDTNTDSFEYVDNESRQAMGGAGIQASQFLVNKNIEAVISGNIGPNSYRVLSAASIKIYSGVTGTVKDAVEKFKKDELKGTSAPDVQSHFGAGSGMGRGGRL